MEPHIGAYSWVQNLFLHLSSMKKRWVTQKTIRPVLSVYNCSSTITYLIHKGSLTKKRVDWFAPQIFLMETVASNGSKFLRNLFCTKWNLSTFWLVSMCINNLTHFSQALHFIQKLVIWFAQQIKCLVSIWNATLGWYGLMEERDISMWELFLKTMKSW